MTQPTSADLIKLLSGGIHPARVSGGASGANIAGASFDEMLRNVEAGKVESGLGVSVARGVDLELNADQMARLASAADAAQAQGASRALVMIDGMALSFDVMMRRVTGVVDVSAGGVFTGFDAVISAGGETKTSVPSGPNDGADNASLLKLLSDQIKRAG